MRTISVNIGSNLGDREANLRFAVDEISRRLGCKVQCSSIYRSESWGYRSDNPFCNIEAEFESELPVGKLLDVMRSIEIAAGSLSHRDAQGNYADRVLDIDIIYAGDEVVDKPALKIPHPFMHLRDFVLVPLVELSPCWRHPLMGKTALQLLVELKNV